MNTHRYTPEKVVKEKLYFSIPLYQRLFTWGKEQVEGLLFDLKNHFETNKDDSPYYMGMLSCIGDGRYDLIDGQQRFTVMTLIAIVLRKYYKDWNLFLDEGKRLDFIARSQDNDYLKCRIDEQRPMSINGKMEAAIDCISEFMKSEKNFSSDNERCKYAKNTFERMSFFFSALPLSYTHQPASLNKYFEAMNVGGKGLEQHEILKVELLKNQANKETLTRIWNIISDMDRPIFKKKEGEPEEEYRFNYEKVIALCRSNHFDEAFCCCESSYDSENHDEIGSIEAKQHVFDHTIEDTGDRCIITFSEFLMMVIDIYLDLHGSYSFYRNELINVFRENRISDIPDFYNQLLCYRLLLDYYILHKEGYDIANKYKIIFKKGNYGDALIQYQSMLYVSQTPFYNWIKPILKHLHDEAVSDSGLLLNWLKDIDNRLHQLPSDVNMMTYDNHIDRYWFWRLDYYLWENKENYFKSEDEQEIVNEYVFRANRSIEHLHPQHQANNEEWMETDIHSFGNLAMISQSFNSEQSDDPITVKFARIMDQAHNHALQSIKMYKMYLDAMKTPAGWTKDIKDIHQQQMYELLELSYHRQ